jgi:hypothetical protein
MIQSRRVSDDRFSGVESFVTGLIDQESQSWIPVRTSAAIQAANIIVSDDSNSIDPKVIGKLADDITEMKKVVKAVHKQLDDNDKQSKKRFSKT